MGRLHAMRLSSVTLSALSPAAALLSTAVVEEVAGVGLGQASPTATVGGQVLQPEEGVVGAPGLSVGDIGQSTGGHSLSPSMSPIPHRTQDCDQGPLRSVCGHEGLSVGQCGLASAARSIQH